MSEQSDISRSEACSQDPPDYLHLHLRKEHEFEGVQG